MPIGGTLPGCDTPPTSEGKQNLIFCPFYAQSEDPPYKAALSTSTPCNSIEIHWIKMQQRGNTIFSDKPGMIAACKDLADLPLKQLL